MAVAMHDDAMPACPDRERSPAAAASVASRRRRARAAARGWCRACARPASSITQRRACALRSARSRNAARGQEVALDVLDAGLDDALLLRDRPADTDRSETVALGALGVGALHQRIGATGAGDRALGVVDDQPLRAPRRTTRRRGGDSRARWPPSDPRRTRRTDGARSTASSRNTTCDAAHARADRTASARRRNRPARPQRAQTPAARWRPAGATGNRPAPCGAPTNSCRV